MQKDIAQPRSFASCVEWRVRTIWVTILRGTGACWAGRCAWRGETRTTLICDWRNRSKMSTKPCVKNIVSPFKILLMNFLKMSKTSLFRIITEKLVYHKLCARWVLIQLTDLAQLWRCFCATGKIGGGRGSGGWRIFQKNRDWGQEVGLVSECRDEGIVQTMGTRSISKQVQKIRKTIFELKNDEHRWGKK